MTLRTWKQKWSRLDADMAENRHGSVKLGELLAEKEAAEQALEEKMERWEYLEEAGGEDCGAGMKNITFHFTKPECRS